MVLIKNAKGVLPFQKTVKRILVAGELGNRANTGDAGSSKIDAPYVVTPLEGLRNYFGANAEIVFCDESELDKAADEAARADCVIIAVGNDKYDEGEYIGPDTNAEFSFGEAVIKGTRTWANLCRRVLADRCPAMTVPKVGIERAFLSNLPRSN